MVVATEVDLPVQTATYHDTIPGTPDDDHVGLNMTMHTVAGDDITYGITFENTGREIVIVRKTNATEAVLTMVSGACDQGYTTQHNVVGHQQTGAVTPTYKILGPFEPSRWNTTYGTLADAVTNRAKITFSGETTGLEIVVVRVPYCGT
jgi:hypothetical protein